MGLPRAPIVLIPARMASTRLPNKPLADIHGEPMIVHVWRRAVEAAIGPVHVACAEPEIARAIHKAGGQAILTRADHPTGSDRIFEALEKLDPQGRHDAVVNVQGDLPTVDPKTVRAAFEALAEPAVDIGTVCAVVGSVHEKTDPAVVKPVVAFAAGRTVARAHYFSRATVPSGDGPIYHHIGLYAYRREALKRFISLPQGLLEQRERLEQLRALENGMRIDVALVDTVPLGVDTPGDLERARLLLMPRS
ncbi:MAG: 3-deoxy-manno-octulosonate cytidylyltransferase [Alphaproteobacteria bacterium]|nr:3-deoxy-manno-octulosonate cytidylyltransferase [Alphaproteobacteria bacterium]